MSLLLLIEKQNKFFLRNVEAHLTRTTVLEFHIVKVSNVKLKAYRHGKNRYKHHSSHNHDNQHAQKNILLLLLLIDIMVGVYQRHILATNVAKWVIL